ncbi:MAG: replication-associated recombination protein A [Planctomycetes bacterium]|nr:replication-associated recombination protein A [Planctomycetota bacterium]
MNPRGPSLFGVPVSAQPLAARMRPRALDELAGQEHLVGAGKPLRRAIEEGTLGSVILWGPPGTGKTTLAHLVAAAGNREFVPFSAVSEGVPRLRVIFDAARERLALSGRRTVLFVDEIHRLNKAQQDSLLPAVEDGTVTLIGATTENPSFEVNGALLSRARVLVLKALSSADVERVLERALHDVERGLGAQRLAAEEGVLAWIAARSDGDARRALTVLEAAAASLPAGGHLDGVAAREALQLRFAVHGKGGDVHYDQLSALHKSLRGSDPHAALYWAARMIEGGVDPLVIFRRAIAMAAEDVGLADPQALQVAVAARDAYHMLGAPEGYLPLGEMLVYLATAPKSGSVKAALERAFEAARATPGLPVPLHVRNAPTALLKALGAGAGYKYAHDSETGYFAQEYLPEELSGKAIYEPGPFGFEKEIAKRLAWWAKQRGPEGTDADGTGA